MLDRRKGETVARILPRRNGVLDRISARKGKSNRIEPENGMMKERTMYRITLKYECFVEFKEINDIASSCGFTEKAGVLIDTQISMNVVEMLGKDQIDAIGKAYQQAFNDNNRVHKITEYKFTGYSNIMPIDQEEANG